MSAEPRDPPESQKTPHAIFHIGDAQGGAVLISLDGVGAIRVKGWLTFLSGEKCRSHLRLFCNSRLISPSVWDQVISFPVAGRLEFFGELDRSDNEIGCIFKERAIPLLVLASLAHPAGKQLQPHVFSGVIAALRALPHFESVADALYLSDAGESPVAPQRQLSEYQRNYVRQEVQKFFANLDRVIYKVESKLLDGERLESEPKEHWPSPHWQQKFSRPDTSFRESVIAEYILNFIPTPPELGAGSIGLAMKSLPNYNFSLAWAKVPFVPEVYVVNPNKTMLPAFDLRFNLDGFATQSVPVPALAPGEEYAVCPLEMKITRKQSRNLFLQSGQEEVPVEVYVNRKRQELAFGLPDVKVLPRNFWISCKREVSIASFVTPHCPKVEKIIRQTPPFLRKHRTDVSHLDLLSDADDLEDCQDILKTIYDCLLKRYNFVHRHEKRFVPPNAQEVRRTFEGISYEHGTCLDLWDVFASCLENIQRHSLLAIVDTGVDRHAIICMWRKRPASVPVNLGQAELRSLIESEDILVLDSIAFSESSNFPNGQSFPEGQASALDHIMNEPLVVSVDITTAREMGVQPMPTGADVSLRDKIWVILSRAGRYFRRHAQRIPMVLRG